MVVLHADGASPAQLQRGVHAALVYFSLHGLDAGDVWRARIKIEDEDIGVPGIQLTAHEEKIWHHWHEAEVAAKTACFGTVNAPPHACLAWHTRASAKAA